MTVEPNVASNKKTFVIDTNVFLHDPNAIYAFKDNNVAIPMIVLEEIDRKKDRMDEVGSNARRTCRILDELRLRGSLREGVELDSGGTVQVHSVEDFQGMLPDELNDNHPDNMIIAVAVGLKDSDVGPVKVVTKDINMRIKCNVIDVPCEDYRKFRVASGTDELYTGVRHTVLSPDTVIELRESRRAAFNPSNYPVTVLPNEFIIDTENELAARLDVDGESLLLVNGGQSFEWLQPRNLEQKFAMKLMYDDRIKLVSLVGPAGTGKTLIAVASALDLMIEQSRYSKLIITRPIQPVGRDLGYLPGTKREKMDPWVQPIYDNIEYLLGKRNRKDSVFDMWMEKGIIEIEAITYIRGRSIANALIIIDEAQNLSVHELKTIVTRAGEGSKIVLTGDIQQIDNSFVDPLSNGLTYAVEKFKTHGIAGHVTLTQGERSELATLATQIM